MLKEMYIGMAGCMVVFLIIGAFFMRPYYIYAIALFIGNLGGVLRIYHIYDVLDQALDMGEEGAKKKVIVNSLLRMAVTVFMLVGSIFLGITAFVGVALGMVEIKICAYFHPQIHKLLIRLGYEKPDPLPEETEPQEDKTVLSECEKDTEK